MRVIVATGIAILLIIVCTLVFWRAEVAATLEYLKGRRAAEKVIEEGYVYVVDLYKFDHECDEQTTWIKTGPCSHNPIGWLRRFADLRGCRQFGRAFTLEEADDWLREDKGLSLEWYLKATIDGKPHVAALVDPRMTHTQFMDLHCPRESWMRDYVIAMVDNPFETWAFSVGFNVRMIERAFEFPSNPHDEVVGEEPPNTTLKLPVRPVTARACARSAPDRPAA
jgi:hypothetical protein